MNCYFLELSLSHSLCAFSRFAGVGRGFGTCTFRIEEGAHCDAEAYDS